MPQKIGENDKEGFIDQNVLAYFIQQKKFIASTHRFVYLLPIFDEFVIAGNILVIKDESSKKFVPKKLVENDIEGFLCILMHGLILSSKLSS